MFGRHLLRHLVCFPFTKAKSGRSIPIHSSPFPPFALISDDPFLPLNPMAASSSTPSISEHNINTHLNSIPSPYLSVRIRCRKHIADMFAEALLCFGASSASMDEEEEDASDSSDEICMNSIFPLGEDVNTCIAHAADSIGLKEIPNYEVETGDGDEWIGKFQESFQPVEVTEGLWIVPEWKTPPDIQATNIILHPGLAFGTGEHPTTKLCLLLLKDCLKGGELFLDYGVGSGILAIAALKFGAALAVGIDIDPVAIRSARQNAVLNNIAPEKMQLHLISGRNSSLSVEDRSRDDVEANSYSMEAVIHEQKYDVVVANILLNPLLDLADRIVACANVGAVVGLSGILSEQIPHITERYSPLLEGVTVSEMDGWACVIGRKTSSV